MLQEITITGITTKLETMAMADRLQDNRIIPRQIMNLSQIIPRTVMSYNRIIWLVSSI